MAANKLFFHPYVNLPYKSHKHEQNSKEFLLEIDTRKEDKYKNKTTIYWPY